jgi:hypothetical protein
LGHAQFLQRLSLDLALALGWVSSAYRVGVSLELLHFSFVVLLQTLVPLLSNALKGVLDPIYPEDERNQGMMNQNGIGQILLTQSKASHPELTFDNFANLLCDLRRENLIDILKFLGMNFWPEAPAPFPFFAVPPRMPLDPDFRPPKSVSKKP